MISKSFTYSQVAVPPLMGETMSGSLSPKGFFSKAKILSTAAFPRLETKNALWPPCSSWMESWGRGPEWACHPPVSATGTEVSFPGLALCTPLGAVAPVSQGKSTIPPTSQASRNESPFFRGEVGILPFPEGLQGRPDYEMRKLLAPL